MCMLITRDKCHSQPHKDFICSEQEGMQRFMDAQPAENKGWLSTHP